jgi:alpha-L-arabinofuranosidase
MNFRTLLCTLTLLGGMHLSAQDNHVMILNTKPGTEIASTMYGFFFEDINYAADGGLYAELVKNRSFEFPQSLMGWRTFGNVSVRDDGPFERCPHYVRLQKSSHHDKYTGLENEGFFGIGVEQQQSYRFSVWARGEGITLKVELVKNNTQAEAQQLCSTPLAIDSKEWKKYELEITPAQTEPKASLRIVLQTGEQVDLEHISLFPVETWKGHRNGLRKDLAQALYDVHPGVLRFPGGCIVEGTDLATRYNWKNSVGPVENRPLNENRWHYTFPHRFFPDYFQSYGLGFFEFFQLAEELGAEPLPILSCGLACQFQNNEPEAHVRVSELQPYIQDALDLVEFANGDTLTHWGALRAQMGHPAPFHLKYIGIGNEQWGPEYPERLKPFIDALRAAYPQIQIVGSSGPNSEGEQFDYLWPEMKRLKADLVDEHFYRPERWFLAQGNRYDKYDRKGPKVFAGEYACHGSGKKWNHFHASLMEAAFMTGLERNADVVRMATYAPLFAHVEGWQWRPDMIWFDNLRSVRTCSYYVQQLYSLHRGTHTLSLTMNRLPISGQTGQDGLFASAVWDAVQQSYILKVVNTSDEPQPFTLQLKGVKQEALQSEVETITLQASNPDEENTVEEPNRIVPQAGKASLTEGQLSTTIAPNTFTVYTIRRK